MITREQMLAANDTIEWWEKNFWFAPGWLLDWILRRELAMSEAYSRQFEADRQRDRDLRHERAVEDLAEHIRD